MNTSQFGPFDIIDWSAATSIAVMALIFTVLGIKLAIRIWKDK